MLRSEQTDGARGTFIDQIGIFPPLLWGYVGLLLFMIGDGVEAGYLSKYLVDRDIAGEKTVAYVFTVYGIAVAISAWLSGALSDLWGPRQVMVGWLGNLGCLRSGLPPAGCGAGQLHTVAAHVRPARFRVPAIRLWIPGVDFGGGTAAPPGDRRRLVLVRTDRRLPRFGAVVCELFHHNDWPI